MSARVTEPAAWEVRLLSPALAVLALSATGALYAREVASTRKAAATAIAASVAAGEPVLRVPHAPGPITLDGDTDDPGWLRPPGPARTGGYLFPDGRPARPYSESRLVWSGDYLFLTLYASDEDIESHVVAPDGPVAAEDAFRVVFARDGVEYAIEVSPRSVIADERRTGDGPWDRGWTSGVHASMEIDGSLNDPSNLDEEWAVEMAVPFASLGMRGERGETVGLSLHRCDTPRSSSRVCTGWGEGPTGHPRGRIILE